MEQNKQLLQIAKRTREALEAAYGDEFKNLPEQDRINVTICVLHDLAKRNKFVMDAMADSFYEMLRA